MSKRNTHLGRMPNGSSEGMLALPSHHSSRLSVIEFEAGGLRSRTFVAFDEFEIYIDGT
jgi:hypothetical protein